MTGSRGHSASAAFTAGPPLSRAESSSAIAFSPDIKDVCSEAARAWLTEFGAAGAPAARFAPATLKQALDGALELGRAAGRLSEAIRVLANIELRLGALGTRLGVDRRAGTVAGAQAPRVAILNAVNSVGIVLAGRWAPELATLAGGAAVLTRPGGPDLAASPADLVDAGTDVLVLALTETNLADAAVTYREVSSRETWRVLAGVRVVVLDGIRFINKPGPTLVRSAELMAAGIHGQAAGVTADMDELATFQPTRGGNDTPGE